MNQTICNRNGADRPEAIADGLVGNFGIPTGHKSLKTSKIPRRKRIYSHSVQLGVRAVKFLFDVFPPTASQ
jgi:hypothetical protein